MVTKEVKEHSSNRQKVELISNLTLSQVDNETDRGQYTCEATNLMNAKSNKSKVVSILRESPFSLTIGRSASNYFSSSFSSPEQGQGFINITDHTGKYAIRVRAGHNAQWYLDYYAFPEAIVVLKDPKGREIPTGESMKHKFSFDDGKLFVGIFHLDLKDSGIYTLTADNGAESKKVELTLSVEDKPSAMMEDVYVMMDEEATFTCEIAGYPESTVTWEYTPCSIAPHWPTCESESQRLDSSLFETIASGQKQTSILKHTFAEPGKVTCNAHNEQGDHSATVFLFIGDTYVAHEVVVSGAEDSSKIAEGDPVVLICSASVYNYSAPITWFKDNEIVVNQTGIVVREYPTKYSYKNEIHFSSIESGDHGTYHCVANGIELDDQHPAKLELTVNTPAWPTLGETNMDKPMIVDLGGTVRFYCDFDGIPVPKITWYKDDQLIVSGENDLNATILENGKYLNILYTRMGYEGTYKCMASNKVGHKEISTTLELTGVQKISKYLLWGIPLVVFILFVAFLVLFFRYRKTKRILKEMKAAGLANFEEGSPECINPAMSLDEQADLLPYNKEFEFPRESLKLGKQLGAGAFGIVVKAVAKGIVHYEEESTVAVKMVKPNADNEVMRALISELKIMVHLGQHVNVVNLLGAVTKDIAKSEEKCILL